MRIESPATRSSDVETGVLGQILFGLWKTVRIGRIGSGLETTIERRSHFELQRSFPHKFEIAKEAMSERSNVANDLSRVRAIDIICQASVAAANHPGNRAYAITFSEYIERNDPNLEDQVARQQASEAIVNRCHQVGARFLARTRRDTWKQISENLAQHWVLQQLVHQVGEARTAQMEVVDMDFPTVQNEGDDDDDDDDDDGNDETEDAMEEETDGWVGGN